MTTDRESDITYRLPEFIAELRRLADALESGEGFDIDGEHLAIPQNVVCSVEHEREDGTDELEFKLSWDVVAGDDDKDGEDEEHDDDRDEDEVEDDDAPEADHETDEEPNPASA
jgi:amphi-Trp domain-containing protein